MRCCEIENQLSAYTRGEITRAGRAAIDSHLSECAECRTRLEALTVLQARLRETMRESVPHPDLTDSVMMLLPAKRPLRPMTRWVWASAAFLLLVFVSVRILAPIHRVDRHSPTPQVAQGSGASRQPIPVTTGGPTKTADEPSTVPHRRPTPKRTQFLAGRPLTPALARVRERAGVRGHSQTAIPRTHPSLASRPAADGPTPIPRFTITRESDPVLSDGIEHRERTVITFSVGGKSMRHVREALILPIGRNYEADSPRPELETIAKSGSAHEHPGNESQIGG